VENSLRQALDYAAHYGLSEAEIAGLVKAAADQRRFVPTEGVTLTHPELPGQPIIAHPDAVEEYRRGRWVTEEEAAAAKKTPAKKPEKATAEKESA
jgi:hypothetical protein